MSFFHFDPAVLTSLGQRSGSQLGRLHLPVRKRDGPQLQGPRVY